MNPNFCSRNELNRIKQRFHLKSFFVGKEWDPKIIRISNIRKDCIASIHHCSALYAVKTRIASRYYPGPNGYIVDATMTQEPRPQVRKIYGK